MRISHVENSAGTLSFDNYPVVEFDLSSDYTDWADVEYMYEQLDEGLAERDGPYVIQSHLLKKTISSDDRIKVGRLSAALTDKYQSRYAGSVLIESNMLGRMMAKGAMRLDKNLSRVSGQTHFVKNDEKATIKIEELLQAAQTVVV